MREFSSGYIATMEGMNNSEYFTSPYDSRNYLGGIGSVGVFESFTVNSVIFCEAAC